MQQWYALYVFRYSYKWYCGHLVCIGYIASSECTDMINLPIIVRPLLWIYDIITSVAAK